MPVQTNDLSRQDCHVRHQKEGLMESLHHHILPSFHGVGTIDMYSSLSLSVRELKRDMHLILYFSCTPRIISCEVTMAKAKAIQNQSRNNQTT